MIEHIEYLLTCHDCVVVPGWGAFIANQSAAHYDEERQLMERPRRAIGFNASVSHNDGLLVQSLMRREGLDYDKAMRYIADSVTTWRQQLAMGMEVSMGRIGYMQLTTSGAAQFVPFFRLNASDQFYGLADLDIQTVAALEQELTTSLTDSDNDERPTLIPKHRNPFTRKAAQIAASVAVLLGLGVLLTTPVIVNRNQQLATVVPAVTAPQPQQLQPAVTVQDNATPTLASVGNTSGRYYMVIASLRNQHELQAFKDANPALIPYMKTLQYKGLTCVYVARSDDYNTLMGLRSQLPARYRDVWIYN